MRAAKTDCLNGWCFCLFRSCHIGLGHVSICDRTRHINKYNKYKLQIRLVWCTFCDRTMNERGSRFAYKHQLWSSFHTDSSSFSFLLLLLCVEPIHLAWYEDRVLWMHKKLMTPYHNNMRQFFCLNCCCCCRCWNITYKTHFVLATITIHNDFPTIEQWQ